jgi:phosphopantetheine adenylyltransferase
MGEGCVNGKKESKPEATASWETPLEKIYTLADILKMLGVSQEELDEINEKRTQRGLKPIEIQINTHKER